MSLAESIETRLEVFNESYQRQHVMLDTVEATITKVAILRQQFEAEWQAAKETIREEFAAEAGALLNELAKSEAPTEGEPETKGLEPPESFLPHEDAPREGEALSLPEVESQLEKIGPETRDEPPPQPINGDREADLTASAVDKALPRTVEEVCEAPLQTEFEVRADRATSAVDEAPFRTEDEVQALSTTSTVDEIPPRTADEMQALRTPSNFDESLPLPVNKVQTIEKQSPGEQRQGAAGLVPSGIFFVAFDSSESLGFGIALMRDKMRGTAHVIVDKIFDPRPSAGQLKILDELVAIGDMRVGTIASMSQFYRIVEQIRRSPRPIVLMFHRTDRRYLQANCVTDSS